MAYSTTEIDKYRVALFPQDGSPAKVSLYDQPGNNFATAYIRPEGETLTKAYKDPADGRIRMYFHRSDLPAIVDLLRHESPVYVHFWEGPGDNTHIATGREPVGENE